MADKSGIIGQWRITEMPFFSKEMLGPAMLTIHDERHGFIQFCFVEASVDYELSERDGKPFIEFTWWEPHRLPRCGRGWALIENDTLRGRIYFHAGDRSEFTAKRVKKVKREIPEVEESAIAHLLRQGPITVDPDALAHYQSSLERKAIKPPAKKATPRKSARKSKGPIPDKVRASLKKRLEKHIEKNWSHTLVTLLLRFHGAFAYVDVQDPTENFPTHLCRLDYLGDLDHWEWAFYKYSDEVYEKSMDWEGSFVTTPEKAFDVAATVYLADG